MKKTGRAQLKVLSSGSKDLTVVIPTAGFGRRLRSYGPIATFPTRDGRTVIRRQIDLLQTIFPKADIVVVVGFETDRVIRSLPDGVRVIENEHFESTGVARSITMGLRAVTTKNALVIYGDTIFNRETIEAIPKTHSSVVIDTSGDMDASKVCVTLDGERAVHFEYGLDTKARWANIVYLKKRELELFKAIGSRPEYRRLLGFEVMNEVIDQGGEFRAVTPSKMRVVEIGSLKDAEKLKV